MNCEQMTVLMSAWLDGELNESERLQLQAHLEGCPECRALFEQLQTLHASFADMEPVPAPEYFARGVMVRVKAEPKVIPLFKRPAVRGVVSVAACAVLCVGLARVFLDRDTAMSESAAAPEASAPQAAAYEPEAAAETESAPAEYSMSYDVAPAPEAPAAAVPKIAPELTEDALQGAGREVFITLPELPDTLSEVLGALEWEERVADGVPCAPITEAQAHALLAMIEAGVLSGACEIPPVDGEIVWMLALENGIS